MISANASKMKSLIQEKTKTPKQNCFLKKIKKGNLWNISCHVWIFYPSLWGQRMKTAWVSNLLESQCRGYFWADFVDRGITATCILFMKYTFDVLK